MTRQRFFSPLTWPIYSFALVTLAGSLMLWWPGTANPGTTVDYVDALFIATSAVCVTGLSTLNIGEVFNSGGLWSILLLVQLGGLGITTYTSLMFLLVRNRVPFTDRLAVTNALLSDAFDLGAFLRHIVLITLTIEGMGAALLFFSAPAHFSLFSAVFHSISAFCNAGFSIFPNNLESFSNNLPISGTIMLLIVLGGLGFTVLEETRRKLFSKGPRPLSRYARTVYTTTLFLILAGAVGIWLAESRNPASPSNFSLILPSFFQSVTARTAGFNTVSIGALTSTSLLVLMVLMFIGGSPGSCAGGIKTTTFRVLAGFVSAQLSGRSQVVISGRAAGRDIQNRALTLFFLAVLFICASTMAMTLFESSFTPHAQTPIPLLDIMFEVVSAFATVGLSTGITASLSDASKLVLVTNMFVGRVGLFTLVMALQSFRHVRAYEYPEANIPLG